MPEELVLGVGGAGVEAVRRLAERLAEQRESRRPVLLALETDPEEPGLDPADGRTLYLTANAAVLDTAYRAPERFHAEWLDRDVLRGRPAGVQGAQGSRMLGRFLLLLPENRDQVRDALRDWLAGGGPRRVWVVAGLAGGTGSGQAADLGYLVQACAAEAGVEAEVRAILLAPPPEPGPAAANAAAALTELHWWSDPRTLYSAHVVGGQDPYQTRRPPFHRAAVLTSLTQDGAPIALGELQDRTAVYLLTACSGDEGEWDEERCLRERAVPAVDAEGNPQAFSTFGMEWLEYPEERIVEAVYRNLARRSLLGWLHGEVHASLAEIPGGLPLQDSLALARALSQTGEGQSGLEPILRPVTTRVPWLHRSPQSAWVTMDRELETQLIEAAGVPPSDGRPGRGPMADQARILRDAALVSLRGQARTWLTRPGLPLDRVGRLLRELDSELGTVTDPAGRWEASRHAAREARRRLLETAERARRDPFLLFSRGAALKKVAREYQRIALESAQASLQGAALPFMRELRENVQLPVRTWSERCREVAAFLAERERCWAAEESHRLERLRREEEAGRLALGLVRLPGKETPFVANRGWEIPYATAEEEEGAIADLRAGWAKALAEDDRGLLAGPGRSFLDGGSELRLAGLDRLLRHLRDSVEDRLRTWLSAGAFQRLAEQHRNPIELEAALHRLVSRAADLPALEPPHMRPAGFPGEFELVFFASAKEGEVPGPLRLVLEQSGRKRETRVVGSRDARYVAAVTEHAGFSMARCPASFQLHEAALATGPLPVSRVDAPWVSASLLGPGVLRQAEDTLWLALAFGLLRPNDDGEIPIPASIAPTEGVWRFPLSAEFDRAARQLAGDTAAREAVARSVERTLQARGSEWCGLQVERAIRGEQPLGVRFPGDEATARRLAGFRATLRHEELLEEAAASPLGRETEWLRSPAGHACPGCGAALPADPSALPGTCPACEAVLLPARLRAARTDGFRRIPNPYVVGTPLETGASVFVGREDILRQVRERLIRPAQRTILILIGERRSGKTSALKQLHTRVSGDLTPVFIDMQGLTATDLPGFLWWLAWRIKESLEERGIRLELPSYESFTSAPPDFQFENTVLPAIRKAVGGGRLLLMLDEFEVLAQRVMNGTFDGRAFDYLRHLMQHSEGLEFLFGGTHILRQFAANYVTFLFNIGVFLDVAFLTREDAVRLIQEPVRQAGVTFRPEAIESVLELAGAHPYFTQMFGFHLVERLNRLRKREVTREDVEEEAGPVIAAAGAHLDHVWGQLTPGDRLLVSFLVEQTARGERIAEAELLRRATAEDPGLRPYQFRSNVEKLVTVGLVRQTEGAEGSALALTAEVYRKWLAESHPFRRLWEEGLRWSGAPSVAS